MARKVTDMVQKRVAGIMRVKNDGLFIEDCIESCIEALDELIIVHNDCTDNSVDEIEKMAAKYPDKIRHYAYPYEVWAFNLSKQQFDYVKNLDESDPHLFSSYSNFALSKVTADYALKIDADQVYFTEKLKEWCDFMRTCGAHVLTAKVIVGKIFSYYLSAYRWFSMKIGCVLPLMPSWLLRITYPAYISYAKYAFSHNQACMALSGVNVLETNKTLISMGRECGDFVMLSPFNGVGDTVMFKMSDEVKFRRVVMDEYNQGETFCVAEEFVHPYKHMTFVGFFWKHLRTMRPGIVEKALEAYSLDPSAFLDVDSFEQLSYSKILRYSHKKVFFPYHRILFGFVYKANKQELFRLLSKSKKCKQNEI